MGLILDDAAISVRLGGTWDGTAPVFSGSSVSFMGRARQLRVTDQIEATNVRGAQGRKRSRFHSPEMTAMLNGVVASTGDCWAFKEAAGVSPVGVWIEITTIPNSNLTAPDTLIGVITKWEWSGSAGEVQIEEIEINLDPDYDA
jgi:hypothetical protein